VHGSALTSPNPIDLDIGIFIYPESYKRLVDRREVYTGFVIRLEVKLSDEAKKAWQQEKQ
jgi:hypothetical protein